VSQHRVFKYCIFFNFSAMGVWYIGVIGTAMFMPYIEK